MNLWLSEGEGIFLVHAVYFSTLVLNLGLDMLCVVKSRLLFVYHRRIVPCIVVLGYVSSASWEVRGQMFILPPGSSMFRPGS